MFTNLSPSALRKLLPWKRGGAAPPSHPLTCASYAAALEACGNSSGYEDKELVEVVFRKTLIYRDRLSSGSPFLLNGSTVQTLIAVAHASTRSRTTVHVIDFGGACGAHYFAARAFFGDRASFRTRWCVVETPAMAERARELQNDELRFVTSLSDARAECAEADLIHSAAALQCVRDPACQLAELVDFGSRFLMLSRVGDTHGEHDVFTVHRSRLRDNGPGPLPDGMSDRECRYPYSFIRHRQFMAILERNYRVNFEFEDSSGVYPVGTEPIVGGAYLAERRG
jgi:putative methyltransferase (TIGR04325 family)